MVKIIVDTREKNSLIVSELVANQAEIELKHLEVADYIIGDVAIERKTVSDFIGSIINKRLLNQLEGIKHYPKRILLIEGLDEKELYNDQSDNRVHPNAIRGMILSSIIDFEVPILFTKDYRDSASFLKVLANRLSKPQKQTSLKAKRRAHSVGEQQQLIIEGFPGIGPSSAKTLLKRFRTIKAIINADAKDIEKIGKIGSKKAEIMKNIIDNEFS